jgi:hypothetical protein
VNTIYINLEVTEAQVIELLYAFVMACTAIDWSPSNNNTMELTTVVARVIHLVHESPAAVPSE